MRVTPATPKAAVPTTAPKVFRGNLEIYSAADLQKLDGVTHVIGNVTIDLRFAERPASATPSPTASISRR